MVGAGDLVRQLPETYEASTTPAERRVQFELYKRFEAIDGFLHGDVLLSWAPMEDESGHVMLHAVFRDVGGSLNTITAALTAKGVDVKRVLAFCTPSGIAIDSFATRGSHSGRRPTTSAVPSPH